MKTQRQDLVAPADKEGRDSLRRIVQSYAASQRLIPPIALDEIEEHADRVIRQSNVDVVFRGFVSVLVGNEAWRNALAATPYERRILLLPQCLRSSAGCPAKFDALGLLCEDCGKCSIGGIQGEAEQLGYVVLVAEGSTAVSHLLASGNADAVVGVSCLHALERSFQPLTTYAVPGMAVPLVRNGCSDTAVDLDWLREVLHLREAGASYSRLDIKALRREMNAWFEPEALRRHLLRSGTATETIAAEWMAKGGKRWRPLLSVCVYKALSHASAEVPEALRKLALGVECFHKASLIHDDIEDNDDLRYGEQTLHREYGMAVALNVGDLLIGEGYRLIAECGLPSEQVQQMTQVAAEGHRTLCLGQGEELLLRRTRGPVSSREVLEIFRQKTVPAFEVALQLGAICAGADRETRGVLTAFSNGLGVAYQIRDDLDDEHGDQALATNASGGPSLLASLAAEHDLTERETGSPEGASERRRTRAEQQTRQFLEGYERQALRALAPLQSAPLKSLLYRVAAMILHPAPPS